MPQDGRNALNIYRIHPRASQRRPELADGDVSSAWENALRYAVRHAEDKDFHAAVGGDAHGRLIELAAARDDCGVPIAFRATTPPSRRTLVEPALADR